MEQNKLYVLVGTQGGDNLDSFAFVTYEQAYEKMKTTYDANTGDPEGNGYDESETHIHDWGFTIGFHDGWMSMDIQVLNHPGVLVPLPDSRSLYASSKDDPDYPGIKICVLDKDMKPEDAMGAAWMEYNQVRNDYADNERLRTLVWAGEDDDPVFNVSFDTGKTEEN